MINMLDCVSRNNRLLYISYICAGESTTNIPYKRLENKIVSFPKEEECLKRCFCYYTEIRQHLQTAATKLTLNERKNLLTRLERCIECTLKGAPHRLKE